MFSEKELNYINASVDDCGQDICRLQLSSVAYAIDCNLPQGHYNMVFKNKNVARDIHGKFALKGLKTARYENIVTFDLPHAGHLAFIVPVGCGSKNIVLSLREQSISNAHKLEDSDNLIL